MEPHTTKFLHILLASRERQSGTLDDASDPQDPDGSAVDIQSLFLTYTLDIATEFFFGHCVYGLDQVGSDRCSSDNASGSGNARAQHSDKTQSIAAAFAEAQVSS